MNSFAPLKSGFSYSFNLKLKIKVLTFMENELKLSCRLGISDNGVRKKIMCDCLKNLQNYRT